MTWKIRKVLGDDDACAAKNCGGHHVLVVGISKARRFQAMTVRHQGVIEVRTHLLQQMICILSRLGGSAIAADPRPLHHIVQFVEDLFAPQWAVDAGSGHGQ